MDIISVNLSAHAGDVSFGVARRLKLIRKDAYIVNTRRGR